jgi:Domain of unknown function (DUF6456)
MSARNVTRALARMSVSSHMLALDRSGAGYGLYPNADRRRRPMVRLTLEEVDALRADGAIEKAGDDGFVLSEAGRARVRREQAAPGEAFMAQHRAVVDRAVLDAGGSASTVRGYDADATLRRLAALRDAAGAPWLNSAELAAASRLRDDWEAGERGMVRGSDWAAPPMSGARGGGNGREAALAAHCDAKRRSAEALARLAPPLRRVVERVCLREEGLEMLERAEAWPARSGKIALKLALAQLASG